MPRTWSGQSSVTMYDDLLDPTFNQLYAPGGKYDFAKLNTKCWVLDPLLFRRMIRDSREVKTNSLGAFHALEVIKASLNYGLAIDVLRTCRTMYNKGICMLCAGHSLQFDRPKAMRRFPIRTPVPALQMIQS